MNQNIQDMLQFKGDVFIVAEIGKGYIQTKEDQTNAQYLENAKQLIKAAKEAGADAVKFQTHTVEDEQLPIKVTAPHFSWADRYVWVSRVTKASPIEFWKEIRRYCDELEIILFSTPMSRGAAQRCCSSSYSSCRSARRVRARRAAPAAAAAAAAAAGVA